MNDLENRIDQWQPCQSGELECAVRGVRAKRRTRTAFKLGSSVAVLLVLGAAGVFAFQQFNGNQTFTFGGITCEQTQANMEAYSKGTLDAKLVQRIETHLAECQHCGQKYREMTVKGDPTAVGFSPPLPDRLPHRPASTAVALAVESTPMSR